MLVVMVVRPPPTHPHTHTLARVPVLPRPDEAAGGKGGRLSEENLALLELQNPKLAAEGVWAHATPQPECGGLLLATPDNETILGTGHYWCVITPHHGRVLCCGEWAEGRSSWHELRAGGGARAAAPTPPPPPRAPHGA
jgi:hypothetical protein